MKKQITILIMLLLLISGCSKEKTLNCTLEDKEQTQEVIAKYKDDKLTSLSETFIAKIDKDYIDTVFDSDKEYEKIFKNIDGIDLKVTKDKTTVKTTMNIDFTKVNAKKIKEQIGENFDASEIIKLKNTDIKTFKKKYLKGYTCK